MSERRRILEPLSDCTGFYYDLELIAEGQSAYQRWEVGRSPLWGRMFCLDGAAMTSEADEFIYHENLAHVPALAHPCPRRALIIGGGDGGSAEELLKHPTIEQIDLVELDAEVIELARAHLGAVHRGALDHPRVQVVIENGLTFVERLVAAQKRGCYDLVLLDLTDPVGPAEALYDEPFFRQCSFLLSDQGLLSLHIGAPNHRPERVQMLFKRLRSVFRYVAPHFHYIPLYGALWGLASASNGVDPTSLAASEVQKRLTERGIADLRYLHAELYPALFIYPNYVRALLQQA